MISKALLIGNGINRLSENDSWLNVLEYLAGPSQQEKIVKYSEHKPFTLIFEEIVLESDRFASKSEFKLKKKAADLIGDIGPNEFHRSLTEATFDNILTTNYDYTLEKASRYYKREPVLPESKYSIFRRVETEKCTMWHIHGDVVAPNTIMLGHEHYLGYVQKIRNYLSSGVQSRLTDKPVKSPIKKRRPQFDFDHKRASSHNIFSWIDIFLRDELHIVGFKLDYTEQHLWSLLTQKEHLKRRHPQEVGETYYHFFKKEGLSEPEEAKASILESLGVEVVVTNWSSSRHEAYEEFCNAYAH